MTKIMDGYYCVELCYADVAAAAAADVVLLVGRPRLNYQYYL
ncbi:MAG: hypothetical protein ACI90V_013454 [Bacillariaceae sp.]|jgi:hypothetical protein